MSHWSTLQLTDMFTLLYIALIGLFIVATNRLFVGKFVLKKHLKGVFSGLLEPHYENSIRSGLLKF